MVLTHIRDYAYFFYIPIAATTEFTRIENYSKYIFEMFVD